MLHDLQNSTDLVERGKVKKTFIAFRHANRNALYYMYKIVNDFTKFIWFLSR